MHSEFPEDILPEHQSPCEVRRTADYSRHAQLAQWSIIEEGKGPSAQSIQALLDRGCQSPRCVRHTRRREVAQSNEGGKREVHQATPVRKANEAGGGAVAERRVCQHSKGCQTVTRGSSPPRESETVDPISVGEILISDNLTTTR